MLRDPNGADDLTGFCTRDAEREDGQALKVNMLQPKMISPYGEEKWSKKDEIEGKPPIKCKKEHTWPFLRIKEERNDRNVVTNLAGQLGEFDPNVVLTYTAAWFMHVGYVMVEDEIPNGSHKLKGGLGNDRATAIIWQLET